MLHMYRQIVRLEAAEQMAAAQVAIYPHLKKEAMRNWWTRMIRATKEGIGRTVRSIGGFTWNGKPISTASFRQRMRRYYGSNLEYDKGYGGGHMGDSEDEAA